MLVWCIQAPSPSWGSLKVSAVSSQKDQEIDAQTEKKYVMSSSIVHESVKGSKQTAQLADDMFYFCHMLVLTAPASYLRQTTQDLSTYTFVLR